jgi:hypothetical protein
MNSLVLGHLILESLTPTVNAPLVSILNPGNVKFGLGYPYLVFTNVTRAVGWLA